MPMFRYRITPLASFASPMQSDTLHGHLLWAIRELEGEQAIRECLQMFESHEPPFVCSSAMPENMLPMPVLPPIPRERFTALAMEQWKLPSLFEALNKYKTFRKLAWLPWEIWSLLSARMSQEALFEAWLFEKKTDKKFSIFIPAAETRRAVEAHNTIDRRSNTVIKGNLFFPERTFYATDARYDLYVRTQDRERFEHLLNHIRRGGFGADRTTGKGHFSWSRDPDFDPAPFARQGNRFMSLSVLSSQSLAEVRGFYKTFTKYGKVWNGYGESNPFKKPFLAFSEGSVFETLPPGGYVLRNVHSDPKIVQVLFPVLLPLTLDGN